MSIHVIREGLDGATVPDVWIEDAFSDSNWNAFPFVYIGFATADNGSHRGLFTFNLSSLPTGVPIISAKLTFNNEHAGSGAAKVHRVISPIWNENQVTWEKRTTLVSWSTPGGDFSSASGHYVDWNFPPIGSFDISGMKVLVEDAIANRGGFLPIILKQVAESGLTDWISITAGESATPSLRPTLTIEYGETVSGLVSLFTIAPPPDIYQNTTLYIAAPMPDEAPASEPALVMDWFLKVSDHDPQIVGTFTDAVSSVVIQLWEIIGGQNTSVAISVSGCYHVGDTEQWGWSTANLPTYTGHNQQFFYLMTADNDETYGGQFFLNFPENAKFIHPTGLPRFLT